MLSASTRLETKGECECCPATDVILYARNRMMMCEACRDKEIAIESAEKVITLAHHTDAKVEVKTDIFNAPTVSFMEMRAAFENNPDIPASEKEYAIVKECALRIDKFTEVIFAEEAALTAKKNERYFWLTQTQELVGKLRPELRAKFQAYNINYKPAPITGKQKSTKPAVDTKKKASRFGKEVIAALYEACAKYGVPASSARSMMIGDHSLTPETAALKLARMMGLIDEDTK